MSYCWHQAENAANIAPMLHKYLLQEFERRVAANPKYSLRAFARDLNVHSGTLSGILNQRRAVGSKVLAHILNALPLSIADKKRILAGLIDQPESAENMPLFIDEDVLTVVKDWEHYAILAYLQLKNVKKSTGDIARSLQLTQARTLTALANLEKVGLVKRTGDHLVVTHKSLVTSREIPSPSLREVHRQYIEKAQSALESVPLQNRDITGTTMAISKKNLPKAKELIRQFRAELTELLEQGEANEVYRLNVQLFPLTRIEP